MKIANLNVDGYGVWSGLRIERLAETLNVFYGPNEAGKTTLLQFLRSTFYGYSPPRRRYVPPLHGGQAGGAVEVSGPNGRFLIDRRPVEADGRPSERLSLTAADGARQGEHFLKVLLSNVDEAVFNNVFAVGLREMQELSALGDTDAAQLLYNLTVGLDRVSLVDVLRELEASRNRMIDAEGRPCLVAQLSAERKKLLAEIDDLSAINQRYARLAAEYNGIDAESTRLDEEANRLARLGETMDLAAAVREPWRRRAELDEQLDALGPPKAVPPRAVERLDALNARIEQHRRRLDRIGRHRVELRREYAALKINETLFRQSARIEALAEQEPWIARLMAEIGELEREAVGLESQLNAEAAELGFSGPPAALPAPSAGALRPLRAPAGELRKSLGLLKAARQEAESARAAADSLGRQLQSSLAALGQSDLSAALGHAEETVRQARRRAQIDGRIEQQSRYRTELEERSRTLVGGQLLPAWVLVGLGAAFVLGVVLLLTGLFMTETILGKAGLTFAVIGLVGIAAAVLSKLMLEHSNVRRLDACRKEIELVRGQIREAVEERDALDARSPGEGNASSRLQAAERELAALAELRPLESRRDVARREAEAAAHRAAEAREAAASTRRRWRAALADAGLPEEMSPKQVRRFASRGGPIAELKSRLDRRREELLRRRRELDALAARIVQLAADAKYSPLPLGEGPGVRAEFRDQRAGRFSGQCETASCKDPRPKTQDPRPESENLQIPNPSFPSPHPNPLPRGEGTIGGFPKGEGTNATDPLGLLRALSEAAAEQRSAVARRDALRRQARRHRTAAARLEESLARLKHRRRELFIEAGVEDEGEYRRRALDHARRETLRAQRDAIAQEINAVLAGRCSEDAVRKQLDCAGAADPDRRREEHGRRIEAVRGELGGLLERRGRLAEQMDSLAGDKQLAAKRLDLAVLEKRLRDAVARWRTLATACRVLDAIRETYEQHRQPETLCEASGYLERLTGGRYRRVWTPLGERSLRVDDAQGRALPVEALSRGTREQLFLGLRLALASCYARRGAQLPLVLDDVLVNFDAARAKAAAAVLRDFAAEGRQLLVFTCHEHIMKLFKSLKSAVAQLPDNSEPGQIVTLEARKTDEQPKPAKKPRPPAAKKPKPRKAAEIEVVEDDEEEDRIDDDSLWDDDADDGNHDDGEIDAAA